MRIHFDRLGANALHDTLPPELGHQGAFLVVMHEFVHGMRVDFLALSAALHFLSFVEWTAFKSSKLIQFVDLVHLVINWLASSEVTVDLIVQLTALFGLVVHLFDRH